MILPVGLDWIHILPAVQAFLHGQNPYLVGEAFHKVYEPFWTFIFLSPFAILPFWVGRTLLFSVSLIAFFLSAIKMGAKRWQAILFLLSAAVIGCLANGNMDWLVTLGLWMPPPIGLFFVAMKPQVGIGIAALWMYLAWREGGVWQVIKTFTPVTIAYLISFALYGLWPLQLVGMDRNPENMSAWPWVVPLGLFLLHRAVVNKDQTLSIISGPLLAPYTSQFSYAAPLMALFSKPKLFIAAWAMLWLPVLARLLV